MGEIELDDGGLAMIKNAKRPNVYLAFETQGDQGPERLIFYNGSLGGITREFATIEEEVEVQTETMPGSSLTYIALPFSVMELL